VKKKSRDTDSYEKKKEKIKAIMADKNFGMQEFSMPVPNPVNYRLDFIGVEPS